MDLHFKSRTYSICRIVLWYDSLTESQCNFGMVYHWNKYLACFFQKSDKLWKRLTFICFQIDQIASPIKLSSKWLRSHVRCKKYFSSKCVAILSEAKIVWYSIMHTGQLHVLFNWIKTCHLIDCWRCSKISHDHANSCHAMPGHQRCDQTVGLLECVLR